MEKPVVLITRPREEAENLASELEKHNVSTTIYPLLEIVPVVNLSLSTYPSHTLNGIIVTSKNATRAAYDWSVYQNLPTWVVGERTADGLRKKGWKNIRHVAQTSSELSLAIRDSGQKSPRLLYLSGEDTSFDFATDLSGYAQVERLVTYTANPVQQLSANVMASLKSGKITHITVYSERTAAVLESLIKKHGLEEYLKHIVACCLSQSVADTLHVRRWQQVVWCDTPTQESMVKHLIHTIQSPTEEGKQPMETPKIPDPAQMSIPPRQLLSRAVPENAPYMVIIGILGVALIGSVLTQIISISQMKAVEERLNKIIESQEITSVENKAVLHQNIEALGKQLTTLQESVLSQPQPTLSEDKLNTLQTSVIDLSTRLAEQKKAEEDTPKQAEAKLNRLNTFLALQEKVLSGQPYRTEMDIFRESTSDNQAMAGRVDALSEWQETGIGTLADLLIKFEESLNAGKKAGESKDTWVSVQEKLSSFVVVKKVGEENQENAAAGAIVKAGDALKAGNVELALSYLNGLPQDKLAMFDPAIRSMESFTRARGALKEIQVWLTQAL